MSRIIDIIESGGVLISPPYPEFAGVVGGLVDRLVEREQLDGRLRDDAIEAVCEREMLSSTLMVELGVSIPHARVRGVTGVIGALAVSPGGVYQAMTGVPVSIVVLVLSSPDLAGDHLNVLAGLSMLLQSETLRSEIARAASESTVIELLREQGTRRGV